MTVTASPMSETVIDREALQARCLGNSALVDRVLKKFAHQLDSDLSALETAIAQSDEATAALVAHRIKGMSANVEARCLFHSACHAERLANAKQFDTLREHMTLLQRDRAQIHLALDQAGVETLSA